MGSTKGIGKDNHGAYSPEREQRVGPVCLLESRAVSNMPEDTTDCFHRLSSPIIALRRAPLTVCHHEASITERLPISEVCAFFQVPQEAPLLVLVHLEYVLGDLLP